MAKEISIKSKTSLSQTCELLKMEAKNMEKIKEDFISLMGNVTSYEDVDFSAATSTIKSGAETLSNALKI